MTAAAPHQLAHLQAQWDEAAAASRAVRRARQAGTGLATTFTAQLLIAAIALALLLPAAVAALTRIPA